MLSNSLADSPFELLAGSAMVESAEPAPGTSVTLTYRDWQVTISREGCLLESIPQAISGKGACGSARVRRR